MKHKTLLSLKRVFRRTSIKNTILMTIMISAMISLSSCKLKYNLPKEDPDTGTEQSVPHAFGENVIWKRVDAIRNDLTRALKINDREYCKELDSIDCFSAAHRSSLGGNEPFFLTQYEPLADPNVLTAVAFERVVLQTCNTAAERDIQAEPLVFDNYDLSAMSVPSDEAYLKKVDEQNTGLYQSLLSRNPATEELKLLRTLTADPEGNPVSNLDVAKLSCFAIATSSEFIFL